MSLHTFSLRILFCIMFMTVAKGCKDIIDNSNRLYCVSFLMTNGEKDLDWGNKWIVGMIMNSLITHKHKVKIYGMPMDVDYIYD